MMTACVVVGWAFWGFFSSKLANASTRRVVQAPKGMPIDHIRLVIAVEGSVQVK